MASAFAVGDGYGVVGNGSWKWAQLGFFGGTKRECEDEAQQE
jgi:hypothetical protein